MNTQVTNGDLSCLNKTTGLKVNSTMASTTKASTQQFNALSEMRNKSQTYDSFF